MSRIGKIILYTILTVAGLALAFVIAAYWALTHVDHDKDMEQQVMLSNSAFLKVHGEEEPGPDSGDSWLLSYHDQKGWVKVGDWVGGSDGNVVACPVGKLVVIARTNGSWVFVRTEAGAWKTFYMEIPGPSPFSKNGEISANSTSLEVAEIETIRARMSVAPSEGDLHFYLGQFLPKKQELWLDNRTPAGRRFRVRLKLYSNGEKFRFVDLEERTLEAKRPGFEELMADIPVDPVCDKVDFTRNVVDMPWARGVAFRVDPKHPLSIESVEGWRVRKADGEQPENIYLVLHGELRLIPGVETYKNLFGTTALSDVHDVGKSFDEVPKGDPFSADAGVWRFPDGKMYFFDNGEYHSMDAGVAQQYGFGHAPAHDGQLYLLKDHTGEPLGPL
jgi:hypothetical protein